MSDSTREICERELKRMSVAVDNALEQFLIDAAHGPATRMYGMLSYFMGYCDLNLKPVKISAGKRLRSGLCLLLAEAYGAEDRAFEASVAIELFHNFTLIHDDVEDRDEMRRGRPTVWKLWGINHAINSGDAQSLLVSQWCMRVARHPVVGMKVADTLLQAFIEVAEGQYLDFELADASLSSDTINETQYMLMIEKKSGALVRVAAEVAGIAAGCSTEECARLRDYGASLGTAYQIADDYASVWNPSAQTGKDAHSDIREHKRTLPFLHARAIVDQSSSERLDALYSLSRQLTDSEIAEAYAIMDTPDVREYVSRRIQLYADRARARASELSISQQKQALLRAMVDFIVPSV